jgi:uncharacterized membrane protein YvlD (DUF360 family)
MPPASGEFTAPDDAFRTAVGPEARRGKRSPSRAPDPRYAEPMWILIHLAVLTVTVLASARYIQGVRVKSAPAAVGVAVVFSVLNFALAWLLKLLLWLPALLTLGLGFIVMPLVVNVILLWLTDKALHVFEIEHAKGLWLMALLITAVNFALHLALR